MHPVLSRVVKWFLSGWSLLWKFFVGGVIVVTGYYANFVDLKRSNVAVEITEIQQVTAAEIDITTTPAFPKARKLLIGDIPQRLSMGRPLTFKLDDIDKGIHRAKQRLSEDRERLLKLREHLATLPEKAGPESDDTPVPLRFLDDDDIESMTSPKQLKRIVKHVEDRVKSLDRLVNSAETEFASYKTHAEKTDAKIILIAAISNSGDGSTTLKPQALLRADLGQGNYLDINLRIANYEAGVGEIKPRGTNILKFESPPISSMAPQDKDRFLNFFKNTSPTNLYVVDVKGKYYVSNTIPFAQGIYEQKIFDGLKTHAVEKTRL
jgi:hypothetical protein